jgi:solute carrier family 25 S-adenosylmethionine transporter 26
MPHHRHGDCQVSAFSASVRSFHHHKPLNNKCTRSTTDSRRRRFEASSLLCSCYAQPKQTIHHHDDLLQGKKSVLRAGTIEEAEIEIENAGITSLLAPQPPPSRRHFFSSVLSATGAIMVGAEGAAGFNIKHASASAATTTNGNVNAAKIIKQSTAMSSTLAVSSDVGGGIGSIGTSVLLESLSGFVAGGALTVTKTVVKYPLDTATVRLQMPNSSYSIRSPGPLFDNCYRGILPPLLSNIPAGAIFFSIKDATKQTLRSNYGSDMPKWASTMISVAVALGPYWAVRNPSEVIKTRQQAGIIADDVSIVDAVKKVWQEESGPKAFFNGYIENILYAYPADVIKFLAYESLSGGRKSLPPLEGAVYGAASTALAQFVSTPLDVVRNRVMMESSTSTSSSSSSNTENDDGAPDTTSTSRASYVETLTTLAKTEGIKGLFAGVTPRVAKALLSGAIQFATYEETKTQVRDYFLQRR